MGSGAAEASHVTAGNKRSIGHVVASGARKGLGEHHSKPPPQPPHGTAPVTGSAAGGATRTPGSLQQPLQILDRPRDLAASSRQGIVDGPLGINKLVDREPRVVGRPLVPVHLLRSAALASPRPRCSARSRQRATGLVIEASSELPTAAFRAHTFF